MFSANIRNKPCTDRWKTGGCNIFFHPESEKSCVSRVNSPQFRYNFPVLPVEFVPTSSTMYNPVAYQAFYGNRLYSPTTTEIRFGFPNRQKFGNKQFDGFANTKGDLQRYHNSAKDYGRPTFIVNNTSRFNGVIGSDHYGSHQGQYVVPENGSKISSSRRSSRRGFLNDELRIPPNRYKSRVPENSNFHHEHYSSNDRNSNLVTKWTCTGGDTSGPKSSRTPMKRRSFNIGFDFDEPVRRRRSIYTETSTSGRREFSETFYFSNSDYMPNTRNRKVSNSETVNRRLRNFSEQNNSDNSSNTRQIRNTIDRNRNIQQSRGFQSRIKPPYSRTERGSQSFQNFGFTQRRRSRDRFTANSVEGYRAGSHFKTKEDTQRPGYFESSVVRSGDSLPSNKNRFHQSHPNIRSNIGHRGYTGGAYKMSGLLLKIPRDRPKERNQDTSSRFRNSHNSSFSSSNTSRAEFSSNADLFAGDTAGPFAAHNAKKNLVHFSIPLNSSGSKISLTMHHHQSSGSTSGKRTTMAKSRILGMTISKESIQVDHISGRVASKKASDEKLCIICQDSADQEKYYLTLRCGHTFHENCICQWLTYSLTCPVCRHAAKQ